ncbi:MAG: hypothetical protein ACPGNT_07770 [Rhodospirillales bacterium]
MVTRRVNRHVPRNVTRRVTCLAAKDGLVRAWARRCAAVLALAASVFLLPSPTALAEDAPPAVSFDPRLADVFSEVDSAFRTLQGAESQARALAAGQAPNNKNAVYHWEKLAGLLDKAATTMGAIAQPTDFEELVFAADLENSRQCAHRLKAVRRLRAQHQALDLALLRSGDVTGKLERQQDALVDIQASATRLLDLREALAVNQYSRYVFVGDWQAIEVSLLPSLLELQRLSDEMADRVTNTIAQFRLSMDRIETALDTARSETCTVAGDWRGDCDDIYGRVSPPMRMALALDGRKRAGSLQVGDKSWPMASLRYAETGSLRFQWLSGDKVYRFNGNFTLDFSTLEGSMGDHDNPDFWRCVFTAR